MCKVSSNSSLHNCDFEVLSGSAPDNQQCDISTNDNSVMHVVKIMPNRKKHTKFRVTGRIMADQNNANSSFVGGNILSSLEWQCIQTYSGTDITVDSESIRHLYSGKDDIQTVVEQESSSQPGTYYQIDDGDLIISISLL